MFKTRKEKINIHHTLLNVLWKTVFLFFFLLKTTKTLVAGCIVAVANLVTVGIIVGVRYHLWRSNGSTSRAHYHLNRLRSATLRPFGFGSSLNPPSTTDQYQLRSADTLYSRRIPGLRSDLLSPEILREQRQQCTHQQRPFTGGVVLCPPTNAQPPQYSQLPTAHTGPPPAYHQVCKVILWLEV